VTRALANTLVANHIRACWSWWDCFVAWSFCPFPFGSHLGNQWSGNPRRNHCRWRELELYCRFWLVVWHIDWKKHVFSTCYASCRELESLCYLMGCWTTSKRMWPANLMWIAGLVNSGNWICYANVLLGLGQNMLVPLLIFTGSRTDENRDILGLDACWFYMTMSAV